MTNRHWGRTVAGIIVLLVTCLLCALITGGVFLGLWMRSYTAFTQKRLVAEIEVSQLPAASGLQQFRVVYKPVAINNALDTFFSGTTQSNEQPATSEFTMYGDQVLVGGPVIKFANIPVLLGFETIYKVARIQGSFIDTDQANQIPSGNVFDLNSGVDDTWKYFENQSESLPLLIDTAYFSLAGKSVGSVPTTYGLYITEDGFVLDRLP